MPQALPFRKGNVSKGPHTKLANEAIVNEDLPSNYEKKAHDQDEVMHEQEQDFELENISAGKEESRSLEDVEEEEEDANDDDDDVEDMNRTHRLHQVLSEMTRNVCTSPPPAFLSAVFLICV